MGERPPSSAPPSYLLEGRYLAEKLLVRGETADVYQGTDTWSGELVAIRRLREDRPDRASAFRRTSERLFGTTSARLLRAINMGEDRAGLPFLVTELLVGRDLEKLGRVRWEVACEISRQAAAAVGEMHILGLHHGALRASTFFVAASSAGGSRVKLLDLGTGDRTATAEKDVWALVSILYRLLLGRPPLPAKARPTAFKLNVSGAPPALEQALGRWLAADGQGLSAVDMAAELKAINEAATGTFFAGGSSQSGARVVPQSSMIMLDDDEDKE
jgi:serine/threonine protein kinase